jgi:KDPG/KHG aldolase
MTDTGLPHLPGVATVSQILSALEAEYTELKFFPIQAAGGANYVKSVSSPIRSARFCRPAESPPTPPSNWPCRTSVSIDFTGDDVLRGRRTQDCGETAQPGVVWNGVVTPRWRIVFSPAP